MEAKKEKFKLLCAVFVILEREGKILLSRRFQTGYQDGKYSFPAGHIDGGETMKEAMIREAKEEINIDVKVDDLTHALTMHYYHDYSGDIKEYAMVFFRCSKWQGEPKIMEKDKCDDLLWADPKDLPANTVPSIKSAIESYVKGEVYSEFGFENR